MIGIAEFTQGLVSIPEHEFTRERLLSYLEANPVDIRTLEPYLYFSEHHYTRNLIEKTSLFELMAICWEVGQASPIHDHSNQKCWMALPCGSLQIHNFAVVRREPAARFCELRSNGLVLLDQAHPSGVDPEQPIHQVLNLPAFRSRAVSLHIYSRPYDTCEIYNLKERTYEQIRLVYTTEYGKLTSRDFPVEKVRASTLAAATEPAATDAR